MQRSFILKLLLAMALCVSGAIAHAQSSFRLTRIDSGPALFISDLNDRGQVVGTYFAETGRPFLWDRGVMTDLGSLTNDPEESADALGMNDRGEVVGASVLQTDGSRHAVLWRNGSITDLGSLPNQAAVFPEDINNRGQIIGDTYDATWHQRPFLQEGPRITLLEELPGGVERSGAVAINRYGLIVGWSDTADGRRAVLWDRDTVQSLGTLPGTSSSEGRGLNDRGQAVGVVTSGSVWMAFLWEDGQMTRLPQILISLFTSAENINNWREIVGTSTDPSTFASLATFWERDGTVHDLNDLIAADDPLKAYVTLTSAERINDRGQIVATGVDSRMPEGESNRYLLTRVQ